MHIVVKLIILLFLLLIVVIMLYPAFLHIINHGLQTHISYANADISKLQKYYSLISSVAGVFISFIGLILGYYYFNGRIVHETAVRNYDKNFKTILLILDLVNKSDELVSKLLLNKIRAGNFDKIKYIISSKYIQINEILKLNKALFSTYEYDEFVKLYSFADNLVYISGDAYFLQYRKLFTPFLRMLYSKQKHSA